MLAQFLRSAWRRGSIEPDDALGSITWDWGIVGYSQTFHAARPDGFVRVWNALDMAVESNRVGDIKSGYLHAVLVWDLLKFDR